MFALCYRDPDSCTGIPVQLSLKEALKPPSSSQHVLKGFCRVGLGFERTYREANARFSLSGADFGCRKEHGEVC